MNRTVNTEMIERMFRTLFKMNPNDNLVAYRKFANRVLNGISEQRGRTA